MKVRFYLIAIILSSLGFSAFSQSSHPYQWWDDLHDFPNAAGNVRERYIVLSPGYMGPNALRVPELFNGMIENQISFDNRFEYHNGHEDQTLNGFFRFNFPLVKDRAVFYISSIPLEYFDVQPSTRDERRMMDITGVGKVSGDIAFGIIYKLFDESLGKFPNVVIRTHAKTTTGGDLRNARYTDASMFHWEAIFSKTLSKGEDSSFLIKLMLGFYTWQTNYNRLSNGSDHLQNDAALYGVGLEYDGNGWFCHTDFSGYHGYIGNRDYPLFWRNQLGYRFKKGELTLHANMGLKKWDWNTLSVNYRVFVGEIK